ncbi:MAG TPA: NAD(P)/FAD-dependent oxidoreductase [Streptosporangiaceae bacterium]
MDVPDAVVVGSGPNGLAAAVTMARAGLQVAVYEGAAEAGGGCRTAELTLPGFRHDVCAAVHPLAAASPFFADFGLAARGVRLLAPEMAVAHPLAGGRGAAIGGTVQETASSLGADARAYRRLMEPLVRDSDAVLALALSPLRAPPAPPRGPGWLGAGARFGAIGIWPAAAVAAGLRTDAARALLAGAAAHSFRPLTAPLTGAFGLILMLLAHTTGWPVVEGGSGQLIAALVAELAERGGSLSTGSWVGRLEELPPARTVLLDVTPRQLLALAGDRLPARYQRALRRFRYGPGVCKVDWALDGPIPWQSEAARRAGTVHVGGTFAEVARSEAEVSNGRHPERPFCLVAQPGLVDPGRAPAGQQALWGYCHVPPGSPVDMSARIEAQIERFAPGFRDRVLARSVQTAVDMGATIRTTSTATLTAGPPPCGRPSRGLRCGGIRTARHCPVCICARRPRHRAAASMACAAGGPPGLRWPTCAGAEGGRDRAIAIAPAGAALTRAGD